MHEIESDQAGDFSATENGKAVAGAETSDDRDQDVTRPDDEKSMMTSESPDAESVSESADVPSCWESLRRSSLGPRKPCLQAGSATSLWILPASVQHPR